MKRKIFLIVTTLLLMFTVVLSGCGEKPGPKDLLQEASEKSLEMKSYSFDGNMNLSLNIPDEAMAAAPEMAMFAGMFQNINMNMTGVYQQDPMKMEMVMDLEIPGDMSFNINLPMVMEEERMLIKMPTIPFVPFPQEVTGKFIEIDYNELAEMSEGEVTPFNYGDLQKQNELIMEISQIMFKHFDEEEYFTLVEDVELPEGIDVKRAVEIKITDEKFEKAMVTFMDDALPELLDLLADPKWVEVTQLESADLEQIREELENGKSEFLTFLEDEQNTLKVNDITFLNGINGDNYISYQEVKMDVDVITEGQTINLVFDLSMGMDQINENPEFTVEVSSDNIIKLKELEDIMNSAYGTFEETPELGEFDIEGLEDLDLTDEEIEALIEETTSN
ncbi:hypothetical protein [Chengkuizengella marina]|uniref:Uncharacterized protein n=1 Tax=Chengkuizengella marina TaxID=2507566 RepID=A0A6N9Q7L6_9BACL|nr:hypothetical protein [Chengkuizengella marina]NBI30653.1 hypothetical protein [Chengkuizengella marina]